MLMKLILHFLFVNEIVEYCMKFICNFLFLIWIEGFASFRDRDCEHKVCCM